ncbi:rCG60772 [Rattus norvegicus]|uniref:RCG60772 n=1 Tax=Rattus norvegicus TaxID=10116 RepID=A6JL07_RAT|nr:rCG60772 [Rattus norvegicus]
MDAPVFLSHPSTFWVNNTFLIPYTECSFARSLRLPSFHYCFVYLMMTFSWKSFIYSYCMFLWKPGEYLSVTSLSPLCRAQSPTGSLFLASGVPPSTKPFHYLHFFFHSDLQATFAPVANKVNSHCDSGR